MSWANNEWNDRAERYRRSLRGVLFKGFSESANEFLHEWHTWIVTDVLLPALPSSGLILDVGCGYGRMASVVRMASPAMSVVGMDLAPTYAGMFAHDHGSAVIAGLDALPFKPETFDAVLAVTSLMYADVGRRQSVFDTLAGLTKFDGYILLVDPGAEIQAVAARLTGREPTAAGRGFSSGEYVRHVEQAGLTVVAKGGNPMFSFASAVPGLATSESEFAKTVLRTTGVVDRHRGGYVRMAMHRWILARRGKAGP